MTAWKFADALQRVVVRTNDDGSMESHSVDQPDIAAWLAAGNVPLPADPAKPDPVPGLVFLKRLARDEYAAIIKAAQTDTDLSLWIDMLRVNGEIDVAGNDALAAKTALVAAGLLTSPRAEAVFAP
jgi:hypothetical protein